jgi:sortase A
MRRSIQQSTIRRAELLLWVERFLWCLGVLCLGLFAWAVIDARWFALVEGRQFDRALRERARAERGREAAAGAAAPSAPSASDTDRLGAFHAPNLPAPPPAPQGTLLGRIEIPRLGISSLVMEGVDGTTLRRGVGHIPATAMPRTSGNIGLAGHRDTVFRGLKDIRKGDVITLETLAGTDQYQVDWSRVVDPRDTGVLATSQDPQLTLVTCYPFYYVGSAPERFIVRAHQMASGAGTGDSGAGGAAKGGTAPPPSGSLAPSSTAVAPSYRSR